MVIISSKIIGGINHESRNQELYYAESESVFRQWTDTTTGENSERGAARARNSELLSVHC